MTDAWIDAGDDANSKLQTYKNTVSGTEVHSEAVTPTDQNGVPFTGSNPFPVTMGQLVDTGNSVVITSVSATGNAPGNPFVGTNFQTTAQGIQECISIVVAFDSLGNPIPDLGFTFTFRGNPEGIVRAVTVPFLFAKRLLHTTDWLSNQWTNYQVQLEPTRALVAGETIVIASRHSKLSGNKFLYPLDYVFLETAQTSPVVQSFQKGLDLAGNSKNIAPQDRDPLNSYDVPPSPDILAGGFFRGIWREWEETHGGCVVTCLADQSGTIYLDRSEADAPTDGVDTDVALPALTFPYEPANGLFRQHFPLQSRWVRLRFENGAAAQTALSLDMAFLPSQVQPLQRIGDAPNPNSLGTMGQQIIVAEREEEVANVHVKTTRNADSGKDGLNTHLTGIDVAVALKALPSWQVRQFSVGNTPVQLDVTKLPNRKALQVKNHDATNNVYINSTSAVNSDNGEQLSPKQSSGMMLDPTGDVWARTEATGVITNYTRFGSTNSGTAASTANAMAEDGVFATISAVGQTINIDGFTAGTTNALISVKIQSKGRKKSTPATETAAFVEVKTGNSITGSVASAALAAGTLKTAVAFISREGAATVTGVSGGGVTWALAKTQASDDANRNLDAWVATGTLTATAVTATMSAAGSNHIAVLVFNGVDQITPIQTSGGTAANSSTVTGPGIAGTNLGMAILAAAIDNATSTAGAGYTERSDEKTASGTVDGLCTNTKPLIVTGTETGTATLSAGKHYACVGITLTPAVSYSPTSTLSYTLSAVAGATSGTNTYTSTTNGDLTSIDITSDRTWVFGDIPNVNIIETGLSFGAASIETDDLKLLLTDSTGITVRVSLKEIAGTP